MSNINQESPALFGTSAFLISGVGVVDHAQRFTTGSSSLGYRLSSVEAQLSSFDPAISYTVTVRQDSSGSPGGVVATLTKPSFSAYTNVRVLEFSAPSTGLTLAADTNYFVVIDVTSVPANSAAGWRVTQSENEDASKADGWTIDNKHRFKLPGQDQSWQDNAITSSLKLRLNGEAIPMPGVTITESGAETTVSEDGSDTDTYTVVLDSEPTHNVTVSVSAGTGVQVNKAGGSAATSQTLTYTPSNWSAEQTITVTGVDDATDNANSERVVAIGHAASSTDGNYVIADAGSVSVAVADDDPTVVSLMRTVGNTGNLTEGDTDKVEFTVRLARTLVAGERIDVPLGVAGTGITATDFTLSKKSGDTLNQGVTLENASTLAPTISYSGADAEEATLEIAANTDSADEGTGETLSVSLGSNTAFDNDSDTNVGGGVDPSSTANTFSFNIEEPDTTAPRITSVARHMPSSSPTNADSLTWRVTFNEAVVNVDAADFTLTGPNSSTNLVVSPVTDAQTTTYDVTVSAGNLASFEGTVTLGFASGQNPQNIEDTSGNALANTMPSGTNDNAFELDNTGPTVTIAGLSGTTKSAVTATFTFNEAVSGFALDDIMVGNGAASGLIEETDDRVWSATITPSVNGMQVTVDVGVDAAQDAAGNANAKATQASAAYTAPLQMPSSFAASVGNRQVALSWAVPADSAGSAVVTKYQLRYSVGSAVNQMTSWSDIADGDDAGSDLDDETGYTVVGLINGTQYAFELRAVNAAGDGAVAKTTGTPFSSDTTAPRIISIVRQSPATSRTDADSLIWRVTFDEAVENVDAADFQVSGTTAILAVSQISGTHAYDITASDGDLAGVNATVTLSFANGHDIGDTSGNALSSLVPTSGTNEDSFVVVNDPNAPQLVSIRRHAQEVRNLGTSLVWRVEFDKHLPGVYASDFTLAGTTAGLDVRHDLSNYDPATHKTVVFVHAQGGDLETVSGTVTLSFAGNHNIRDFEGRALASTTPTSGTSENSFTLDPAETLVYFTQADYYVDEGDEAVVTVKLSRLRDTATTISSISATPLTATGNQVDYHGQTFTVTIPAYRAGGTVRIRTTDDTLTEDEERFRIDIHGFGLPAGVVVGNVPGGGSTDIQAYVTIRDDETATARANKEPGLVFDNARLTWNEADGCDDTGPAYNVRLKTEPLGPVEVLIEDPDDDYRSDAVARGRLYVANTAPSVGGQGGAYEIHDDGTYSTHPLPELDEDTVLRFTPDNWDTWQQVNVKVRCADHYTAQVPIRHRMYAGHIDKYTPSPVYPGHFGIIDRGWTVHVKVREADPPIVVRHLPVDGGTVRLEEGGHRDFEITLSEAAFEHASRVPVYLSARGGRAAGVRRRDGDAHSCGGPLDDCLYLTPENRTRWVRLFAIGPGRDELKVEIPQLLWGDLIHARDWELRWPVTVERGICGRTTAVRQAIVGKIPGVSHCRDVTPEHLAAIVGNDGATNNLNLSRRGLSSLQAGDFWGLTNLKRLRLDQNSLATLPAGIFDDLAGLQVLDLDYNQLTTLRPGVFDKLTNLRDLYLNHSSLTRLPDGVFRNNQRLALLWLHANSISTLPPGIFDRNTALVDLGLYENEISTLPPGIFDRNTALTRLLLRNNQFTTLPDGIFDKLTVLANLNLHNNPGAPFRPAAPDAGPDQTVATGAQVTLSGVAGAGGPWGDNVRLYWWQVDGPASNTTIGNDVLPGGSRGAAPTFTAPAAPTVLHFRLAATPRGWIGGGRGKDRTYDWVTITVGAGQGSPQQDEQAGQAEQAGRQPGGETVAVDDGEGPVGPGPAPVAVDLPAPVAHWRFDGDAGDSAGSSHGTAQGGASFAANDDGGGVGSHALVLDGIDDHVDLAPHVSSLPLGDAARSVTGWFRAGAGSQRQTFLSYGPNLAGRRFSIAADRTQVVVAVSGHARGVNGLDLDDGWHHVAVTYSGGDSDGISIYLDGALQAASTLVGAPQSVDTRAGPAAIGRNAGGAHYAGSIDDVRIYNMALGAEQVLALVDEQPQTPPSPAPVTTAVTASVTPALAEGSLDGAGVALALDAGVFAATVSTSDVTASGVPGLSVSSVTRDSDGRVTATLAFDGTDFDADATLTLMVSASALAHSDTDLSATLPVTAVDEPPPPPPAVPVPAPVAHWKFDGDAGDSAGSNHGVVRNGASFTTAARVGSHALALDGGGDHVDLSPRVVWFPLEDSARSVTGWFRADAGSQGQAFFSYGPNAARQRFSVAADRTQAVVGVSGYAWGVRNLGLDDGWHHVAVTYAGGGANTFSIYVDGVLQPSSLLGGFRRSLDTRIGPATIGRSADGTSHYGGEIDDVRLYGHALSAGQVRAVAARREGARPAAAAFPVRAPTGLRQRGWSAPGMSWGLPGAAGAGMHHGAVDRGTPNLGAVDIGTPTLGVRTHVPLLPGASNPRRGGLVRIVNPSRRAGGVRIVAVDDAGRRSDPVVLGMGAGETLEFTSRDLEWGGGALDPRESTGPGIGDWRLEVESGLDVKMLPYVRAADGTLAGMGGVAAPSVDNVHRVALFHPADSPDSAGLLRLTNRGGEALVANITGIDDTGASPGGKVSVEVAADASVLLTAADLEAGGADLLGALGDGGGAWRLDIASDGDLAVMSLVETPDGHLANLSNATATPVPAGNVHGVAGFPSGSVESGEAGVLRIVNGTGTPGSVRIRLHDGAGWRHATLTLTLGGGEAANLGALDLELGNESRGLSGGAGPGAGGEWHLEISGDIDIEVMALVRLPTGLLEALPRHGAW